MPHRMNKKIVFLDYYILQERKIKTVPVFKKSNYI